MKERPILFSAPMARAILEGRKTQTRRVVKPQKRWLIPGTGEMCVTKHDMIPTCPYGVIGDRLWVRETWAEFPSDGDTIYRADFDDSVRHTDGTPLRDWLRWRPSIFLPRRASRITLEIVGVRVERIQDTSEEDARAEGMVREVLHAETGEHRTARDNFSIIWDSINGAGAWASNPWVWALTFKRVGAL